MEEVLFAVNQHLYLFFFVPGPRAVLGVRDLPLLELPTGVNLQLRYFSTPDYTASPSFAPIFAP